MQLPSCADPLMETLQEHNENPSGPTGLDGLVSLSSLKTGSGLVEGSSQRAWGMDMGRPRLPYIIRFCTRKCTGNERLQISTWVSDLPESGRYETQVRIEGPKLGPISAPLGRRARFLASILCGYGHVRALGPKKISACGPLPTSRLPF